MTETTFARKAESAIAIMIAILGLRTGLMLPSRNAVVSINVGKCLTSLKSAIAIMIAILGLRTGLMLPSRNAVVSINVGKCLTSLKSAIAKMGCGACSA